MSDAANNYRVMALKYRPQTFRDLIGQDVLVRTLTNAFAAGRIANGYMLTGIRGIGKTTSARIIAKALNCEWGVSADPCGACETCRAIAEDRHIDVIEIDAASNTGVDSVRDIIDATRYKPALARFKVYIVDEVHMLSKSAFNALLKTLEEPPPHVKFVFATTEIRKVPVTILSRTQRFDLKRVEAEPLRKLFAGLLNNEGIVFDDDALALIARAADGSVRDGLSLLDQAVVHGEGRIETGSVKEMLGLSDRTLSVQLFRRILEGKADEALALVRSMYQSGADPTLILSDLLDLDYRLTRAKQGVPEPEVAGMESAPMADLALLWQALLKGLSDLRIAPDALQALEMLVVRLIYMTDKITETAAPKPVVRKEEPKSAALLASFADVAKYAEEHDEMVLAFNLSTYLRVTDFSDGAMTCSLVAEAPKGLVADLQAKLAQWTGKTWNIVVTNPPKENAPLTLKEQADFEERKARETAMKDPNISLALNLFEGAGIAKVRATDGSAGGGDNDDDAR